MTTLKKEFDAVEMKRKGSKLIYEQIRGMTPEQELEFWKLRQEEWSRKKAKRPTHE